MRVSFLERALKPAKKRTPVEALDRNRDFAEQAAIRMALSDYHEQKKIEGYLHDPKLLEMEFKREQEEADFLRSRGLKPRPSSIPEQFRKGLKGYRPRPTGSTHRR